ncbi:hypothetical protein BH23ACT8_BH23ACT8_20340 [soil metagenome]
MVVIVCIGLRISALLEGGMHVVAPWGRPSRLEDLQKLLDGGVPMVAQGTPDQMEELEESLEPEPEDEQ